jgi:hypothetical protein
MQSPPLSGLSILVVEGNNGVASDLRTSLIELGAKVHVVANAHAGFMISMRKRIDGAILDCVNHGASLHLCTQLAKNAVPFMYYGGDEGRASQQAASYMADLVSIETSLPLIERRRNLLGSGADRHLSLV